MVLTRSQTNGNHTTSVTWPGYIGTLSGMNSEGLALTENMCGSDTNKSGIPNSLLFTHILDRCKNLSEAENILNEKNHGSSANLMIADKISAKSYEFYGKSKLKCVDEIE